MLLLYLEADTKIKSKIKRALNESKKFITDDIGNGDNKRYRLTVSSIDVPPLILAREPEPKTNFDKWIVSIGPMSELVMAYEKTFFDDTADDEAEVPIPYEDSSFEELDRRFFLIFMKPSAKKIINKIYRGALKASGKDYGGVEVFNTHSCYCVICYLIDELEKVHGKPVNAIVNLYAIVLVIVEEYIILHDTEDPNFIAEFLQDLIDKLARVLQRNSCFAINHEK